MATKTGPTPDELAARSDSARDAGPKTSAAERAERWHREHNSKANAARQRRDAERAERRERHQQRGEALKEKVEQALEEREERRMELHRVEERVQALRDELNHLPADLHSRIDTYIEAAERRVKSIFAKTTATPPRMMPRPGVSWVGDWLMAHDPEVREAWHAAADEAMADSSTYTSRQAKAIEADLKGAVKAVEAARESEREAHAALGLTRRDLHSWEVGR